MNKNRFREKQLKYWRKRNNELHKAVDLEADEVISTLQRAYKDAENSINQNIAQWYQKLADNNEISLADAKKWLAADELADFKMTLDEYIRHGEELDIDPSWKKAMINASSKHHISSYEAQKMLAQAEIEEAVAKIDGSWIDRAAETAYLHRLYDAQIAKGTMFRAPNVDRAVRSAKRPWTPDGMEFVERAHVNNAKLVQKIHRDLTQAAITGESYEATARRISKDFALTVYESVRIVRTESCHIETEASMQAYRDCGIDQYQILATLDRKTCRICADMDMQVVNLSDRMDGYNAPPFHPNCRCTTIAYFADMEDDDTSRVGRNEEGRNVPMDGSITYDEWAEEYGTNGIEYEGIPKSWINIGEMPDDEALSGTNPRYNANLPADKKNTIDDYSHNCANCVVAYEMRKRGYPVTACSVGENKRLKKKPFTAWKGREPEPTTGNGLEDILKYMDGQDDGVRIEISVHFHKHPYLNTPDGHAFVAERRNGETIFIDPQTGRDNIGDTIFQKVVHGDTIYMRIDDLEISDRGVTACKKI